MIKFGITNFGDVALTDCFVKPIRDNEVDAAILISKSIPSGLSRQFMIDYSNKIIFHATTTGLGRSVAELDVDMFVLRMFDLIQFLQEGFPASHVVIRVDPILFSESGLSIAENVIRYAYLKGFRRFRYSFLKLTDVIRQRYKKRKLEIPCSVDYNSELFNKFDKMFSAFESQGCVFEACKELTRHKLGCISERDYDLCNLDSSNLDFSDGRESNCLCKGCKVELIENPKKLRCKFNCLYCYLN